MALPQMTPEKVAENLAKAARARAERSAAKAALKNGKVTLAAVLDDPDSPLQGARVLQVLRALPGVGPVKAQAVMQGIGIDEGRRLRGLGERQRQALKDELEPARA